MATENEPLRIIGNESNTIHEIEPGTNTHPAKEASSVEEGKQTVEPLKNTGSTDVPPISNDLATNDGSVMETLDTAFHGKFGVAEGENPSGSDRADYFERKPDGKSDAEEEISS